MHLQQQKANPRRRRAYLDKGMQRVYVEHICCQPDILCPTTTTIDNRPKQLHRQNFDADDANDDDAFGAYDDAEDNHNCLQLVQDCPRLIQDSAESAFQVMKVCSDRHWNPQTELLSTVAENNNNTNDDWPKLFNFVGHMSTAERDAEALLRRLGAWDDFGATGWGPAGTERFFQKETAGGKNNASPADGQWHATHAHDKLALHMTPTLHAQLLQFYRQDYDSRVLNLTVPPVPPLPGNAAR